MRGATFWMLFAFTLGCGSGRPAGELPTLEPVTGQVLRDGEPVAGGMLRFRQESAADSASNLVVSGAVDDLGRFQLSTTHALSQQKKPGAPAGEYTATYFPYSDDQDALPIEPPDKFTVVAGPNELSIELSPTP